MRGPAVLTSRGRQERRSRCLPATPPYSRLVGGRSGGQVLKVACPLTRHTTQLVSVTSGSRMRLPSGHHANPNSRLLLELRRHVRQELLRRRAEVLQLLVEVLKLRLLRGHWCAEGRVGVIKLLSSSDCFMITAGVRRVRADGDGHTDQWRQWTYADSPGTSLSHAPAMTFSERATSRSAFRDCRGGQGVGEGRGLSARVVECAK